jgi:hypothetical protein
VKPIDLRTASAPERDVLSVCPHCWEVNIRAHRLCGRCGADMHTVLQESGGLRWTAAVQSPVPVRGGGRHGLTTPLRHPFCQQAPGIVLPLE